MNLMTLINRPKPVIIDGGLGSWLVDEYKCSTANKLWSSLIMKEKQETVYKAHKDFCDAGAQVIITNTYQASIQGFDGDVKEFEKYIRNSVEIAKKAANDSKNETGRIVKIAGSCGTIAADQKGSLFIGMFTEDEKKRKCINYHKPRFDLLDNLGVDLIAFETITSSFEGEICSEILTQGETKGWVTFS